MFDTSASKVVPAYNRKFVVDPEILAAEIGFSRLREAVAELSQVYREARPTKSLRMEGRLLAAAYLAVRFPATQAAAGAVARAIAERAPGFAPRSLLDLGAGCGAAALAFQEAFGSLLDITAIEALPAFVELGREALPKAIWRTATMESLGELAAHDVVLFGYSLGETAEGGEAALDRNLERAWAAAEQMLVVIEPGTMAGWGVVARARKRLLAAGAKILAPCPSGEACPMSKDDWCHFSVRLARTSLHRKLKGGELGFEDEKFSYLVAARGEVGPSASRILRHPLIAPGRIQLDLCEAPGRGLTVVTKANKVLFRVARKVKWGDLWDRT